MEREVLLGTDRGLWRARGDALGPVEELAGREVTALARAGADTWALVEGRTLWMAGQDGVWGERASIDGPAATCLAPVRGGLLIGTAQARLLWLRTAPSGSLSEHSEGRHGFAGAPRAANRGLGGRPEPPMSVASFETVEGRDEWYTPWGDPADVRSITVGVDGAMHVNVHVGGVARSRDDGRTWTPTVDIETDVHQVLAHPTRPGLVLVAAYEGFGISRDGGDSWRFVTAGMHAHYARAVAISGDDVLVSASRGFRGRRSALYRKPLDGAAPFERCHDRLPWFDDNIDTACLAAEGPFVVFGTEDGRIFQSRDGGASWELVAKGLPAVRCVTITGGG